MRNLAAALPCAAPRGAAAEPGRVHAVLRQWLGGDCRLPGCRLCRRGGPSAASPSRQDAASSPAMPYAAASGLGALAADAGCARCRHAGRNCVAARTGIALRRAPWDARPPAKPSPATPRLNRHSFSAIVRHVAGRWGFQEDRFQQPKPRCGASGSRLALFLGLSSAAEACASCGCTLTADWLSQGLAAQPGTTVSLRYDYIPQIVLQNRHHDSGPRAPSQFRPIGRSNATPTTTA